ncbi:loricrin-like [Athalia rosae]|uniref:loricrin-like n=1 Tax=Athalia rosae TaxID=37344 RepID=UPI0020341AEF|nr:loricrin-like [Athalia rosae]
MSDGGGDCGGGGDTGGGDCGGGGDTGGGDCGGGGDTGGGDWGCSDSGGNHEMSENSHDGNQHGDSSHDHGVTIHHGVNDNFDATPNFDTNHGGYNVTQSSMNFSSRTRSRGKTKCIGSPAGHIAIAIFLLTVFAIVVIILALK